MLLEQRITTTVAKEVSLPYYCKQSGAFSNTWMRVNKDNSVLTVSVLEESNYACLSVSKSASDYERIKISEATPCPADEVQEAIEKAVKIMDGILLKATA